MMRQKKIAKEIVRCENGIDRTYIALDYFDASINRISAWVTGFRSFQKALLDALCQPSEMLKELQDTNQMSKKMVVMDSARHFQSVMYGKSTAVSVV